jgi:DNA helicase IV
MTAMQASPAPDDRNHSVTADIRAEQGYVDWAYERLDGMLANAVVRKHAGVHAAAGNALWKMSQEGAESIRVALADTRGLVVGRLDMIDHETLYVGRHSVDGEDSRPAVVDWRADWASRFYQATRTFPAGVGRRRSLRTAGRTVTGIDDETLVVGFVAQTVLPRVDPPPVAVHRRPPRPTLAPVDNTTQTNPAGRLPEAVETPTVTVNQVTGGIEVRAADLLLEDLARERTGVLEDIVATIQADQDQLVRAPYNVPLVIQGGPGTGKTIVGLHRAAWVLYQQRQRLIDQSVLVVGPNRRFIDYIGSVLPSLGETDVRQVTIDELALDGVSVVDRDRVKVTSVDRRDTARIKGDPRMVTVIQAAIWSRVRARKLSFSYGRFTLRLDEDQVDAIVQKLRGRGVPYRAARRGLLDGLAQAFADEYVRRLGRRGLSMGGRELKQLMAAARVHLTATAVATTLLPKVEPAKLLQQLYEDPDLVDHAGASLTLRERALLHRPRQPGRKPPMWTPSDLPLLDEAVACIRGESRVSGHVVVDEAQDLSPMQWRVLARRTSQASMTILGDLGQATSAWAPRSWANVTDHAGLAGKAEIAELTLGYRVPQQVMDFASPLLTAAAPGVTVPHSFRVTEDPVVRRAMATAVPQVAADFAIEHLQDGGVAIIAPVALHEAIQNSLGEVATDVTLLTPEAVKGLEFDVVVVAEPTAIAGKTHAGMRLLYIALTRPTKKLIVVHSQALPGGVGSGHRPTPPSTYPNPRNDDPWDNDAVHWLLEQAGGAQWTRGVLMECLRRQPNQMARNRRRVDDAARLARCHGVIQERTPLGKRPVVRLYRTDPHAPPYPLSEAGRRPTASR